MKAPKQTPDPNRQQQPAVTPAAEGDELDLFRQAMADVRPLPQKAPQKAHVPPHQTAPSTRPRQSEADERAALAESLEGLDFESHESYESGDTLQYRMPGIQDSVWRRLKRGSFLIQSELDLHGYNRDGAQRVLVEFLAHCQDRGYRCVRIIHGKGNGSPNTGPVIKRSLDGWLRKRRDVLAFCSARPEHGGTGAAYVLLRQLTPGA